MHAQMLTTGGPLGTGSLLADRYRILDKVGEGGFGVVYKARDTRRWYRLVAIKQINLDALSPRQIIEATDSYNREVTILSRLSHPNLPRIYGHFTDPTHWYLVMQYIKGETLDNYLKRAKGGHLELREVCAIGVQLSEVLEYLHAHNPPIIFRDVKPANIMRTRRGRLYLIDFGIARYFDPEKKRDTGPLGSPGYAAPEQYGQTWMQSTAQTDIYGLGATLHTLLTGKEPFDDEPATLPMKLPGRTTQRLQHVLDTMQATDTADRPRGMREVKERLFSLRQRSPSQKARSFLIGLFSGLLGWLPYLFLALVWPFLWPYFTANPHVSMPLPLEIASLLFMLWPLLLVCQGLLAFYFLDFARPRRYLVACGILLMLALIILAVFFGWLPSPDFIIHHLLGCC